MRVFLGAVAVNAINHEASLLEQVDPRNRKSTAELKDTYKQVNLSEKCAAAIEVAKAVESGLINEYNFLPEDLLPGMKGDSDRMHPSFIQLAVYGMRIISVGLLVKKAYDHLDEKYNGTELEQRQV